DDEPGVTYQDLTNMAAVTIRHREDGKIQMVTFDSTFIITLADNSALLGIYIFSYARLRFIH
ncbi:hypothetical protein AVEN_180666-1, partial [Araneus ventricosus]